MNSKDLRNLAEAYQNIQEEPRRAKRRRSGSPSYEEVKNKIDAKNPTKTGPVTGQKVPGVQQSRPATRIPNATGGAVTGSLRSGNLSFPGDRSGAYAAAKQSLSAPTVTRDAGAAVRQRFMTRLQNLGNRAYATAGTPSTMPRGTRLTRGLKGLSPQIGAEIGGALLEPVANKAGEELGKALTRGVASVTGTTDKMRSRLPSYYGAAGPDLTRDIAQGIKSREPKQPRGMSNIPPAEGMVNNPDYGKPGSVSKPEAPKPAPKPPTAKERAYGARSKLTAAQQELNKQYDIDRGLEGGRVTKPYSSALDKYLAKRKK